MQETACYCSSLLFLSVQCNRYANGQITGSLCKPLCATREIQFQKCVGGGFVKLNVIQAEWNRKKVILKTDRVQGGLKRKMYGVVTNSNNKHLTRREFIAQANQSLHNLLGSGRHTISTREALEKIFSECDLLQDERLTRAEEVQTCWNLVKSPEYVFGILLEGSRGVPNVYGVCGEVYGVEYASTSPFDELGDSGWLWTRTKSWQRRAKLALALLEMIESIEETPYGVLHLCDVKEDNFGLVQTKDGKLIAKAIDINTSWLETGMNSTFQSGKKKPCKTDHDCSFHHCHSFCNTTTGRCSGILVSSNLQVRMPM